MLDLTDVFAAWLEATDRDVEENRVRMGVESDWLCMEARSRLKDDPSGLLTALTLRSAYKTFIQEHNFTIEDLLNGAWEEKKAKFERLRNLLFEGEIGIIYNRMIEQIIKNAAILGKEYTSDDIDSLSDIEKILTSAAENFQKKFKHERFAAGNGRSNAGKVLPKLFRFTHFKEFVRALKSSPEDNFVCLAFIDRTNEVCRSDYDEKYDHFFCFGIKNAGSVYTVSDRVTWDSPEHYYKTRSPARDMEYKLNYSYFPYRASKKIKNTLPTDTQLLLQAPETRDLRDNSIFESDFNDSECVYLAVLCSLVYSKYFLEEETPEVPMIYFSSDVKFLPAEEIKSTELAPTDVYLTLPALYTTAKDYTGAGNIHNDGVFDYLIEQYPLSEELSTALMMRDDYICTLDKMQTFAWWLVRKAQATHIEEELQKNKREKENNILSWIKESFIKNAESIIKHALYSTPYDDLQDKYNLSIEKHKDKPFVWEVFRDGKDLDASSVACTKNSTPFKPRRSESSCFVEDTEVKLHFYGSGTYVEGWIPEDNSNRVYEIKLRLRSHTDFEKFFNSKSEDLPKEIRRHICARKDALSYWCWKPYDGNSILHMEDPMNDIENPYEDISFTLVLHVSKSMLKKLEKGRI